MAIAHTAKGNRIAIRAGAVLPERFGGIVEIHHRATVVTEIELLPVFDHRIDLPARHGAKVFAATGARVVTKNFQRHDGAAIHAVRRPHADDENVVAIAGILERALDGLAGGRIKHREPPALERRDLAPVAEFHLGPLRRARHARQGFIITPHEISTELDIDIPVAPPRDPDEAAGAAPSAGGPHLRRQQTARLLRRRIEHHQIALLGTNADVHFAVRPDGEAARIHFRRVHPAQVFHRAALGIEADEFCLWIRAGVELAVRAGVVLPEVILGGGWLAHDFNSFLRLLRIKAQDQCTIPRAEINFSIRPGDQRPRARPLRRVELPRLARVGVHLHQEKLSADLVEIEIERLAAAPVRPDDAAHQTAFAHRNAQRLKLPNFGRFRREGGRETKKDQRPKVDGFHRWRHHVQPVRHGQAPLKSD